MPTKAFKAMAKKSDKSIKDMERYWDRAEASYERQQDRADAGERPHIRDKHSYIMATTLRQAQRTGPRKHKPLAQASKPKNKKDTKEGKENMFANKIDSILEGSHDLDGILEPFEPTLEQEMMAFVLSDSPGFFTDGKDHYFEDRATNDLYIWHPAKKWRTAVKIG